MGVEAYNFVSAVNGIFSQRLLRILCRRCRRPVDYTRDQLRDMGVIPVDLDAPAWHEAAGCPDCFGTGYRGRMATGELVPFTEEIRDWMIQRRSFGEIRSGIRRHGVASIRDNALSLARKGLTSIAEVNRVTSVEEG
jgi:type IV pilus assembly protein PilB